MKYLLYLSNLPVLFCFTFCIGCKKVDQQPNKPDSSKWLLSKIYLDYENQSYLAEEFIYKGYKRPQVAIYRNNQGILWVDSFIYDSGGRLSQMHTFLAGRVYDGRKDIHYDRSDRMDTIRVFNRQDASIPVTIFTYKYTGDTVKQYIHGGDKFSIFDSISYSYDKQRNLSEWRVVPGYGLPYIINYQDYDNCYNIYSYLNMNVYLPSKDGNLNPPYLSKNNYRIWEEHSFTAAVGGSVDLLYTLSFREYTLDSLGLIRSALDKSPKRGNVIKLSYEYIPAK